MRITVRAKPGSRRNFVYRDDNAEHPLTLIVHVRARPVAGAANQAVVSAVADALGVRVRDVTVARGHNARVKLVELDAEPQQIRDAIAALPSSPSR